MRDGRIVWVDPPEVVGHLKLRLRPSLLDGDYLSAWYPRRAAERRAYLERIGKTSPFWLGTPDPGAA